MNQKLAQFKNKSQEYFSSLPPFGYKMKYLGLHFNVANISST